MPNRNWKKLSLAIVLVIAPLSGVWAAGTDLNIAEPEYAGNIVHVQGDTGVALEKQKASNQSRAGFFKARGSNIVKQALSPVRISKADGLRFIVRAQTNDVDPVQIINVFQLTSDPKRKYRYIRTSTANAFSGASSSMDIDFIGFTSSRYGETSYLIELQGDLEPGEYAMTLEGSRDLFNMFGLE